MTAAVALCHLKPLPRSMSELSHGQLLGRECVSCGRQLTTGAVPRGVVPGRQGVHVLDAEVWSCPDPDTEPSRTH